MEGTGSDKQDVIGAYETVTCIDSRTFDNGQNIALNTFTAYVWPVAGFAAGNLVYFIEEDNSIVLDSLDREPRHLVHVDKLLLLFLDQVLDRFSNLHFALLRALAEETGKDIFDIDIHFFDAWLLMISKAGKFRSL